ncbi:ribonuclease H-like domain-containing protein [Tanacetum coccineum]
MTSLNSSSMKTSLLHAQRLLIKLLIGLKFFWNTHAIVWRNKADLETMSMDDLYNNLKVYEPDVKGMSSSSSSTQNMAFVSSSNNNLYWARAVMKRLTVNSNENIGFDKSKVDCYNCHKKGHFARECRTLRIQDCKNKESTKRNIPVETSTSIALVSCDGLGGYDWSDQAEEGPNYALMAYSSSSSDSEAIKGEINIRELRKKLKKAQKEKDGIQFNVDKFENASKSLNKLIESQIVDNCKKGLGYNAVLPPYTGNFMPLKPDLSFIGLNEFVNEFVECKAKTSEEESKVVKKSDDAPFIEEWVSDNEEENVTQPKVEMKIVKPSFAKIEFVKPKGKTARKTAKQVEQLRQNTHIPRGN